MTGLLLACLFGEALEAHEAAERSVLEDDQRWAGLCLLLMAAGVYVVLNV